MRKVVMASVLSSLTLLGCAPTLERQLLAKPIYEPGGDTLWLIERETSRSRPDEIAVIVCHRDATPACIRLIPLDARDSTDYARWRASIPQQLRAHDARASRAGTSRRPSPPPEQTPPAPPLPTATDPSPGVDPLTAAERPNLADPRIGQPAPTQAVPRAPDNPY